MISGQTSAYYEIRVLKRKRELCLFRVFSFNFHNYFLILEHYEGQGLYKWKGAVVLEIIFVSVFLKSYIDIYI